MLQPYPSITWWSEGWWACALIEARSWLATLAFTVDILRPSCSWKWPNRTSTHAPTRGPFLSAMASLHPFVVFEPNFCRCLARFPGTFLDPTKKRTIEADLGRSPKVIGSQNSSRVSCNLYRAETNHLACLWSLKETWLLIRFNDEVLIKFTSFFFG